MLKFREIPYQRLDKDQTIASIKDYIARFKAAKDGKEQLEIYAEFSNAIDEAMTMYTLAYVRFTQDTRDEFYNNERDYYDEIIPTLSLATTEFDKAILESPFRDELATFIPPIVFKNIEISVRSHDEKLIPEEIEVNKLTSEYSKLMSGIMIDFNGETLPPSGLGKYFSSSDRELRRGAFEAFGKALSQHKAELDEIYDKLVKHRTAMGKLLGHDTFSPLGYDQMGRNCYGKDDIAAFRANVKKYIVPLVSEIKAKVGADLGINTMMLYDNSVYTKTEPKPIGTPEEIFAEGAKMYANMGADAGELFKLMQDCEAFDALSRPGKQAGGYCTDVPKYKIPFIFSNFNGTSGDIEVLTHEFGHALAFYKACDLPCPHARQMGMETAEVHSMSMEFLTYPYMEKFFGDKTDEYKFQHIAGGISFIPYGTIVDYFQQTVYDNPDMTPEERNAFFLKCMQEFMPSASVEGMTFFEEGRYWQRQGHIFESPFYYIDYCLAQFTAFQFLALAEKDYDDAYARYMKFLRQAGSKPFTELLDSVGLKSPFEEESFVMIVDIVRKLLKL